jgi:hypothetical protein
VLGMRVRGPGFDVSYVEIERFSVILGNLQTVEVQQVRISKYTRRDSRMLTMARIDYLFA